MKWKSRTQNPPPVMESGHEQAYSTVHLADLYDPWNSHFKATSTWRVRTDHSFALVAGITTMANLAPESVAASFDAEDASRRAQLAKLNGWLK